MESKNLSQTELIKERFIELLSTHEEFTKPILVKIKELADFGKLNQNKKVEDVIKVEKEG